MAIDLTTARSKVEELTMLDECDITADAEGMQDAALNEVTGELANPAAAPIYSGKCSVKPDDTQPIEDASDNLLLRYTVTLPYTASGVREGHAVTMTATQDPDLMGQTLRVVSVDLKTLMVSRKLRCELEAPELEDA